jgi:hypothetical protein
MRNGYSLETTLNSNQATQGIKIDASLDVEEWSDGSKYYFDLTYPSSSSIEIYLKNDNSNLFVGINITNYLYSSGIYPWITAFLDHDSSLTTTINDTKIFFPTDPTFYNHEPFRNCSLSIYKHNAEEGINEYMTGSGKWAIGNAKQSGGIEGRANLTCEFIIPLSFLYNQNGVLTKINFNLNRYGANGDDRYIILQNADSYLNLNLNPSINNVNYFIRPTILQVNKTHILDGEPILLSWNAVSGASYYKIYEDPIFSASDYTNIIGKTLVALVYSNATQLNTVYYGKKGGYDGFPNKFIVITYNNWGFYSLSNIIELSVDRTSYGSVSTTTNTTSQNESSSSTNINSDSNSTTNSNNNSNKPLNIWMILGIVGGCIIVIPTIYGFSLYGHYKKKKENNRNKFLAPSKDKDTEEKTFLNPDNNGWN